MRFLLVSTSVLSAAFLLSAQDAGRGGQPKGSAAPPAMTLTIPGFPDGGQIPVKFSQAAPGVAVGEGTSPAMSWANVPVGTQKIGRASCRERVATTGVTCAIIRAGRSR